MTTTTSLFFWSVSRNKLKTGEKSTDLGVQCQMRFHPYLLSPRTWGRSRLRRLRILSEGYIRESLKEADKEERCFIVGKLYGAIPLNQSREAQKLIVYQVRQSSYLLTKANPRPGIKR